MIKWLIFKAKRKMPIKCVGVGVQGEVIQEEWVYDRQAFFSVVIAGILNLAKTWNFHPALPG